VAFLGQEKTRRMTVWLQPPDLKWEPAPSEGANADPVLGILILTESLGIGTSTASGGNNRLHS